MLTAVLPLNLRAARLDDRVELPIRGAGRDSEAEVASGLVGFVGLWCLSDASRVEESFGSKSMGGTGRRVSKPPLSGDVSVEVPLLRSSASMSVRADCAAEG